MKNKTYVICRKEKGNEYDPHPVAVTRNNDVVGRALQKICDCFWKFLFLPKTSIRAWVLGKRVTVVQVTAFKFLYALFFKAMSKE